MFLLLQWALETPRLGESSDCCPKICTPSPWNYTSEPKVINVSSNNIVGDISTLIFGRETQLAPSTKNTLPIKKKNNKVSKGKSQMTNAPLSLDWISPQGSLIDLYHHVGPNVEMTNSWAGEVPVGISLIVDCLFAGPFNALSNCWARPVP